MKFNVSISGADESNRGIGFNLLVEAANVLEAVDKGKEELKKVMEGAGLQPKPVVPITPTS